MVMAIPFLKGMVSQNTFNKYINPLAVRTP
jgi:hypothetical protein